MLSSVVEPTILKVILHVHVPRVSFLYGASSSVLKVSKATAQTQAFVEPRKHTVTHRIRVLTIMSVSLTQVH